MEVEKEIWRNISGYPGYKVSNLGRVKSMERNVKHRNSYRKVRERILKPNKNRNGYLMVPLCNEGKNKTMLVHRLVAKAFVQNYSLFNTDINHINEIKTDNRAENLEWCTKEYNNNYGTRNEKSSKSKINGKKSKAVICIETGKFYPSTREVERQFGFSHQSISACCEGKLKSAYKYHWKWAD